MKGFGADRPGLVLSAMVLVVLAITAGLWSMDAGLRRSFVDLFGYGGPHSDESSGSRDLYHSGVPIAGEKNGETYAAYDARRYAADVTGFRGFGCPDGCDRHEAGYAWAKAQGLSKAGDCKGPSWGFVEGCAAYMLKAKEP